MSSSSGLVGRGPVAGIGRRLPSPFRLTTPSPIAHSTHEPDSFFVDFRHIPSTVVNLGREISSISSAVMKRSGWWACSQINSWGFEAGHIKHADFIGRGKPASRIVRSEEHTSELPSLMRISYAVVCLNNKQAHPSSFYSTLLLP